MGGMRPGLQQGFGGPDDLKNLYNDPAKNKDDQTFLVDLTDAGRSSRLQSGRRRQRLGQNSGRVRGDGDHQLSHRKRATAATSGRFSVFRSRCAMPVQGPPIGARNSDCLIRGASFFPFASPTNWQELMEDNASTGRPVFPHRASRGRTVLAGAIGNVLEWYDFGLFGYRLRHRRRVFPRRGPDGVPVGHVWGLCHRLPDAADWWPAVRTGWRPAGPKAAAGSLGPRHGGSPRRCRAAARRDAAMIGRACDLVTLLECCRG